MFMSCVCFIAVALAVAGGPVMAQAQEGAAEKSGVWIRVRLVEPDEMPWKLHVTVYAVSSGYNYKTVELLVGEGVSEKAEGVGLVQPGGQTSWVDLTGILQQGVASVVFAFEPEGRFSASGVQATFEVATSDDPAAIVRSITDHDPGNLISLRIPPDLVKQKDRLVSIREDARRRLQEVQALGLPAGPLPKKIWCISGLRGDGQFYTDPEIARLEMQTLALLGINGLWRTFGPHYGEIGKIAREFGMDRSTVYWRAVLGLEHVPSLKMPDDGGLRLDWDAIESYLDESYRKMIASDRQRHPEGMVKVFADLDDEPAGNVLAGPGYQREFRLYLEGHGLTPEFFGKRTWDDIVAPRLDWWKYFDLRAQQDLDDVHARRTFYWAVKFWSHAQARFYAMATRAVEKYAPGVLTRVNFGPPSSFDYGTMPRGIDAFEMGRLRGVSLAFNEDWIGHGQPRRPLEMNTYLMDFTNGALRPQNPLAGAFVTKDADREAAKLRTFGLLARGVKMIDFYNYGPAYALFEDMSDNPSMIRGVGELTREIGQVDDLLWEAQAPNPEVALLFSKSWPVWKEDETELTEQMMVYLALLHAGIPVDLVSDEEIADGRFAARGYKCLYVVHESVPADAARAIELWVRDGGRLWTSGWGAMRNEYNTPTDVWDGMLGIRERTWEPTGDLSRLGERFASDDWARPFFARRCRMVLEDGSEAPAEAFQRSHSKGTVRIVPYSAGRTYMDGHQIVEGGLTRAIIYPADERREVIAGFALESGVEPPATTSVSQVLAWPLWTMNEGLILIANFTGEAAEEVEVDFFSPVPIKELRSLAHGKLEFEQNGFRAKCVLPVRDVTDIIVVK